jgi:hypothetical protein
MDYTALKREVDDLLVEHGYTYEKIMFQCWGGFGQPPILKTLQRKNTSDTYTFMTGMTVLGIYDLHVKRGDGPYFTLYSLNDR